MFYNPYQQQSEFLKQRREILNRISLLEKNEDKNKTEIEELYHKLEVLEKEYYSRPHNQVNIPFEYLDSYFNDEL